MPLDNYFYLSAAFKEKEALSAGQEEALEIVWQKVRRMLFSIGLEIIMDSNIPFNSKTHEAVENRSEASDSLKVIKILQPGYKYKGKVIKCAKVITTDNTSLTKENEQ
ncbi:co-chaperone GrpE [Candidatus Magnetoovum chiemensis]|nr:co-chaperone GrpE [Candidatus Magnetoovum chiemensis]